MVFGVEIEHIRHRPFRASDKIAILVDDTGRIIEELRLQFPKEKCLGTHRDFFGQVSHKSILVGSLGDNPGLSQNRFGAQVCVPVNDRLA